MDGPESVRNGREMNSDPETDAALDHLRDELICYGRLDAHHRCFCRCFGNTFTLLDRRHPTPALYNTRQELLCCSTLSKRA